MKTCSLADLDSPPVIDPEPVKPPPILDPADVEILEAQPLDEIEWEEAPTKRAKQVMELVESGVSVEEAKRRMPFTLDPRTEKKLQDLLTSSWVDANVAKRVVQAARMKVLVEGLTKMEDPDGDHKLAADMVLKAADQIAGDPSVGLKGPDTVVNVDLREVEHLRDKMKDFGYKEEEQ